MPSHFSPAAMTFLRGLARNNDRNWFNARKSIYERELKAPMLALIDEITQSMADYAPEHMRPAHKSMMRIYRDIRFSPDKRPYKTHLSAWWTRRGMEKTSGGGFYLHIGPKDCFLAAGVYMPERDQLLALRRWMAENHRSYRAQLNRLLKPRGARTPAVQPIDAEALSRMPKGFPACHPADELLRARNWGVRCVLPASLALEPELAREVIERFRLMAPIVDTLNSAILSAEKPSSEPLHRVRANAFL
ncbi:MAG TPA: DUF2461 domain-containing protein [Candidatus Aquilonibacter sp.]|nr:DUF2461 domain-containing protein [Candidatus Aquilonibacter sp.]